jgi:hypothetical protein
MKLRKFAAVGLPSIVSLVLVGSVAYADCSGPAGGSPHVTPQTLSVVLSANGATGNGTPNITLGPLGPTGSSFTTSPDLITITNNGTMTATEVALKLSDHNNNSTLEHETWACLYSDGGVFFNEPLTTVEGYGQTAIGHLALAPGATDTYTVVYYAGSTENTGCGHTFSGFSAVPYDGYSGQYNATEPYPTGTTNSAALSLTNLAEGGIVTPTVTVSFTGVAGTLTQVAPFSKSVTAPNSGSWFSDQLAVSGSSGTVTYTVTSSNSHLKVSGSGAITTVGGPLGVNTYTVSGTDIDSVGDTGTWTYTLYVTKGTLTQVAPFSKSVTAPNSGSWFSDQLAVSGSSGTVTYTVTSSNSYLRVSPSGAITTVGGPLGVNTYTVSGTDIDSHGDTGTWTYTLYVTKGIIICTSHKDWNVTRQNSGGDFDDWLAVSGSSGATTYTVTSPNSHLHVSPSGAITTFGGPLGDGTYTFSGTDTDSLGDTGTWSYSLTVSH